MQGSLEKLVNASRPEEILSTLLSEVRAVLRGKGACLFEYDPARDWLQMTLILSPGYASDPALAPDLQPFTVGISATQSRFWRQLMDTRRPFLIDAAKEEHAELFWPGTRQWHIESNEPLAVGIPLAVGDVALGFLGVSFSGRIDLSDADLNLAQAFGHQAALTLHMLRLAEVAKQAALAKERERAARQRVRELSATNDALKRALDSLSEEPDINRSISGILGSIARDLGADHGALWLRDPATDTYAVRLVYYKGEFVDARSGHPATKSWPLARDLRWRSHIRRRRPILHKVAELPDLTDTDRALFTRLGIKQLLGLPLTLGSEVIGSFTLRFTTDQFFSSERLALAQTLAHQATLALQLTRLAADGQEKERVAATLLERNRLARDIHDTIAQHFMGVIVNLDAGLTSPDLKTLAHHAEKARETARSGLEEARLSVKALRAAALQTGSISQGLRKVIDACLENSQISWTLSVPENLPALHETVEQEFVRIVQEACTNVRKHSGATRVLVSLDYAEQAFRLSISDDGNGFDIGAPTEGFGLIGMGERAKRVGATLTVSSRVKEGTVVRVMLQPTPDENTPPQSSIKPDARDTGSAIF
ncbi:signal transduction histidine kinase [Paraburkholderia bannensis]|uniref:Signal transduction histidine kinase n=1 Tax=Paraburkholderia bannensis TaxID=765414 RepID=A0A7W9U0J2_9BURK|nr:MULTISPECIES: GAF domain-containing sensor histidine kinase [Paraburkholderia]MBB3259854.1 signal transduction histidine kinase [Paraburkholderia sp. WP4_3_2]MBB6104836.1 signal transduction histidine kinase [Paraburkholderia bannensis]